MLNKRVLILSLAYYPVEGGAEIAVKEITDRITGLDFEMVTMRFEDNHLLEERVGNVLVHRIKSSKITFPIDAYLHAKKLHQKNPYDAVWAIMAARAGGAALFFKYDFPSAKFILTLQEGDPVWYMKLRSLYYINPFFRKIFINADKVQSISNYLADYAHAMGHEGKVEVIPNGVDYAKFQNYSPERRSKLRSELGYTEGDTMLVTTSRLVKKNGITYVIDALKILPDEVKFLIIGEGIIENSLKSQVQKLNLASRVRFVGHVPYAEIPEYLHASDIFIRPSLSEGFGNSFIEAMAVGLPVLGTPVGGIVDFLYDPEETHEHPPTGLFVEPKDSESIAKQVLKIMDDKDLAKSMSENAKKMVEERYDWNLVAEQMKTQVFERVL